MSAVRDRSQQVRRPGAQERPTPIPAVELTPALVQRWVENQARELAIRAEEVKLRAQEIEAGHRFAEKSLEAQTEDRRDPRTANRAARRDVLCFLGFLAVLGVGFFAWLLHTGNHEIAMELLKLAVYGGTTGSGGYVLGKSRERKKAEKAAA